MTLKKFLDSHPVATLIGLGAAVVSATASVTAYFGEHRVQTDKVRLEAEYKNEISSLKTRLASIERKVGGDEKSFFDITRMIVAPDQVRALGSVYSSRANGAFFVSEPSQSAWKYVLTTELSVMKEALLGSVPEEALLQVLGPALKLQNVHMWRADESVIVRPRARAGMERDAPARMKFYPYVIVQIMTEQQIGSIFTSLGQATRDEEALARAVKTLRPLAEDSEAVKGDRKLKVEEVLSEMFQGDAAAVMMVGFVNLTLSMPQLYANAKGAVTSAQKKGNVLYLQTRLEFADVQIEGRSERTQVLVDTEYFVITSPQSVFVVKVQVPSFDGRSEAFSWIAQWLTGLRIPLARS
jgi:hypothetical protein